ncbi:cilia- and flagella-associated protein 57 [Belonocnema kinseyi]|uniref:cilia- and flagella-associated protein 57 n=1 Tax=Belonocnema kinseyi TaxID=2817044 RepID=UPI00143DAA65|nr:cilia- and flagella-associated protein 57 [Belonocnema kinseyi]
MSTPHLQCRIFYGLKTDVIGNAHYITDGEIFYPVGSALSIHHVSQRRQKLIRLSDKQINIIAVASNRKYAAVCEVGEKPTIAVYDLRSLKRKKALGIPYDAPGVDRFSCLSFTLDNKYIVAITGEPDQMMLFYNWEKGKVESNIKVGNPQNPNSTVNLLACNPGDVGIVAIGGPFIFKFLTVSETVWRPYGFTKADNLVITSLAWMNLDRLLAGTRDGKILYLENGELKNIYKMIDTTMINLKIREEYVMQTSVSETSLEYANKVWEHEISGLTVFSNYFAFAFGPGRIVIFEQDGQHKYVKQYLYKVPAQISKEESDHLYRINTINSNLSSDRLIVTTGWSQIFFAKVGGSNGKADPEERDLETVGENLHHGPIGSLSMCTWKPIFMTCGELDCSVRIWDYESESLVMIKQYMEDIFCVALHPNGLFCLVGFSDKLRFMTILIDDLLVMHEFPIRNCRTAAFSHGGHLFAAVNGNIIHVYSTMDFRSQFLLKGHTGKIKGFVWSKTDAKLVSIGLEGAIYEWDMCTGARVGEVILKEIILNGIVLSSDNSTSYCISSDNQIREIKDSWVSRSFTLNLELSLVAMGKENSIMLATCSGGAVLSIRYPLQEPVEYLDFRIHRSDITEMALAYNEQMLITTGADGTLCFWKVLYQDNNMEKTFYTNEVLIGRSELEEKLQNINELAIRIGELETEHAYKLRQFEVQHNDSVREIHQGYCEAIQVLKENIEQLQEDHVNELNTINTEIVKMKTAHEKMIQQIETSYEAKLITEYNKYQDFEEKNSLMREEYEQKIKDLEETRKKMSEELISEYEAKLYEKNSNLEELREEMEHRARIDEQMKIQIEDDADREIVEIRAKYEHLLYEEKQANLKLKGEVGVLRNKFFISQKETDDLKRQVNHLKSEQVTFQKSMQELDKEVLNFNRDITERDTTIQEKERQIYDLNRDKQELEKFKFVLEHKINELRNQIEPKDKEVKELKEKIRDMETELVNLHKVNVNLELQYHGLEEKLGTAKREFQAEVQKNKKSQMLLKKMHIDVFDAAGLVQEPRALKTAVMNLYHKYCNDEEFLRIRKEDLDVQCEFIKQRDHLERTIASLRKQVFQDTSSGSKDTEKLMDENVMLIVEMNSLREGLKRAQKHISDMEYLLGVRTNNFGPVEARNKLAKACHGNEELQLKYKSEMQECQRVITVLKDDIRRLVSKIIPT